MENLARSIDQTWYKATDGTWAVKESGQDGFNAAPCAKHLRALAEAGVPETATIELAHDTPDFTKGKHTLTEIRTTCAHIERVGRVAEFQRWAILSIGEYPHIADGSFALEFFQSCTAAYAQLIKGGIPPTEKVLTVQITGPDQKPLVVAGAVEELRKKWCDPGMAKAKELRSKREAPYRRVLKGDKLKLAIEHGSLILPGGLRTDDPAKLVLATVWFSDVQTFIEDREICKSGGTVHVVHRYQFNSEQILAASSEKTYCGSVPTSAYK